MQAAGIGMVESQKFSLVLILSRWQKSTGSFLKEDRLTKPTMSDGRELEQRTTKLNKVQGQGY